MADERFIFSTLKSARFFLASGVAIALDKYLDDEAGTKIKEEGNGKSEQKEQVPELNVLTSAFVDFLANLPEERGHQESWENFVWNDGKENSFLDSFGFAICFADLHNQEIHKALIPKREQIEYYIDAVTTGTVFTKEGAGNISLQEQFSIAMEITNNSPISAVFLALIGSRMLARRMDKRLYEDGEIKITDDMMQLFKGNIASFYAAINLSNKSKNEFKDPEKTTEDPGDVYYFWTSCYMGILLRFREDERPPRTKLSVKNFYRKGVDLMMFARKHLADQPNYSSHRVPEQMGFDVGWALADEVLKKKNRNLAQEANLNQLTEKLWKVQRFQGFSQLSPESVGEHTFNSRRRAKTLSLDEKALKYIDQALELHDVAEAITGDFLAHEKDADKEALEILAIDSLDINEEKKQIMHQVAKAKGLLMGESLVIEEDTPKAVIAAIIDFIDAAEKFHIEIPHWVNFEYDKKNQKNKSEMPGDNALVYAIETYKTYMTNLDKLGLSEKYFELGENLLIYILDWIVSHWNQVEDQEKIPKAMKNKLKWAEEELKTRKDNGKNLENLPGLEEFLTVNLF